MATPAVRITALVLAMAGVLSLRWSASVDDRAAVPDCGRLVAALPDGTWSASRPDPDQHYPASWAACELTLTATGRTATVRITGETTDGRAAGEVEDAPCDGTAFGVMRAPQYSALRRCSERIQPTTSITTVVAARGPRWAYVVVNAETVSFELAQQLIDKALNLAV